jgi:hypothetical protein
LQKRQRTRFEERRDGRTRFAGRVQDMPVIDVIQTIEIMRAGSGRHDRGASGDDVAVLRGARCCSQARSRNVRS